MKTFLTQHPHHKLKLLLCLILSSCFCMHSNAQSISGIINTYTPVLSIDTCNVTVGSTAGFSPGDRVMLIQMKGATIDITNTASFGSISSYNDAGNYELCTIQSISGSVITLQYQPMKTYTISGLVQLIRVPVYTNATVTGTLTCQPWNGTTGGVLAFIDNGTTVLNADIDVKYNGFRGTTTQPVGWVGCAASYAEADATIEALKGESIAILGLSHTKGVGAPANGGGGGRTDNGGGGASNFGDGGQGGNLGWTAACNLRAQGGKPLSYNNTDNKIFLGGAGGDAQRSEGPGINMGVNGGGIVLIRANEITGNGFSIIATGEDAVNTIQDGGGGGGAGGVVLLDIPVYTNTLNINTSGGKGGDAVVYFAVLCSGGGGGGGGALWVSTPTIDPNIVYTTNGGLGGLSNSSVDGDPGLPGGSVTELIIPESTVPCTLVPVDITNVTCNGYNDGEATIELTSGGPYTYLWSTGDTSATITGLAAGNYTCIYTDSLGISDTVSITITEPAPLTLNLTPVDLLCAGDCNGTISAVAGGGVSPYSYAWNTLPAQTTSTASALCAGTYTCTVTDDNGCVITDSATVYQPAALSLAESFTPCSNNMSNATATVIPSGGTAPYTYSWNTVPVQTTSTATGLGPGTYIATVTDSNGCSDTLSVTIPDCPPYIINVSNVLCNGQNNGSASISIMGGFPPYTYLWSTGATTASISGLVAGSYTCIITDSLGNADTVTVVITQPSPLSVNFANVNPLCFGYCTGTSTALVAGGTAPYTYAWNTSPVQTAVTATGLCEGNFTCSITDNNGCALTQSISIVAPSQLNVTATYEPCTDSLPNGTCMATATGGTPGYSFAWNTSPVQNTPLITGLLPGSYTVVVTDTNDCVDSVTAVIPDCPPESLFLPNVFSPGGDGINDAFTIQTIGYTSMYCQIFDRWGVKIFEWNTVNGNWPGTNSNGKPAVDGVYYYVYQAEKLTGELVKGSGFVHLVRERK
ncbi:MAG TPA: gliding motility-associated C-terminal domain-containing protein [Flavobacteriales bacterium]|nr:gliding motility-associated C-terminal domain-containing protein [Flavobacteriales bacterium]